MAGLDDILKMLPIDQIAAKLGVDNDTAAAAVQQGGAAILTGLQQNASTADGSAAITAALGKHADAAPVQDVAAVNTAEGGKILQHVFGDKEQEVTSTLNQSEHTAGIDFSKLLPMLAPVVMGMLAKGTSGNTSAAAAPEASSGGLGGLLGGLLGGGNKSSGGGLDIGGLLGGLLGK